MRSRPTPQTKRLIVNMPRDQIHCVSGIRAWQFGHNPSVQNIFANYAQDRPKIA